MTVRRTNFGAYTFDIYDPSPSGARTIEVSATSPKNSVVCGVVANTRTGSIREIKVTCRGPQSVGPMDTTLDMTYARGINPLGLTQLSSAYANAPNTTASKTALGAGSAFNMICGVTAGANVYHQGTGKYEVELPHQNWHVGAETAAATAQDSMANCRVTNTLAPASPDSELLWVTCTDEWQSPLDSAFQLQYTGVQ